MRSASNPPRPKEMVGLGGGGGGRSGFTYRHHCRNCNTLSGTPAAFVSSCSSFGSCEKPSAAGYGHAKALGARRGGWGRLLGLSKWTHRKRPAARYAQAV